MNKYFFGITILCCLPFFNQAQDATFTQFYSTPLELNPALTGGFEGKYRFSIAYRDQWRQAVEYPSSTIGAALDLRFPIDNNGTTQDDAAGVGLLFNSDRVPNLGFNTTRMGLYGAYHKSLNEQNTQFLSAGIQLSINQRGVNFNSLTFEDQFDGSNGFLEATAENFENTFAYFDLSLGLNYSYAINRQSSLYVGGAIHHVTEPQVSFFFDREGDDGEIGDNVLHRRITGHIGARFPIAKRLHLLPRVMANLQGPHFALNAGSNIRVSFGEYSDAALHVGGWARAVTDEMENLSVGAAIFMVGFETNNVLFGFSYDLPTTGIQATQTGQSVFEFTIAYLGNYVNETVLCPEF